VNDTTDCLFCRIVAGEVPSDTVLDDADVLAFRDIEPQAPTHVVVIPKTHHRDLAAMTSADPALATRVIEACTEVAGMEQLAENGYRVVFNTGSGGGQAVFHVHGHVLGGRRMTWPPG
jgi:histidine triad (HIT) family protein